MRKREREAWEGMTAHPAPLIVVGGGAGGHAAVSAFREHGGEGSVVLVSGEDRAPYFRPDLTKGLVTGAVALDAIGLEVDEWYSQRDITLALDCHVDDIDIATHTLATSHGPMPWGSLIVATGSRASRPPIPGADDPRVVTVRSAADGARLLGLAARAEPVIVIGSGFVGCEAASSLAARGVSVSIAAVEALPQQDRLGPDAGVQLIGGESVERIEHAPVGLGVRVHLASGRVLEAASVIVATGAEPAIDLARSAGLVCDGCIDVQPTMRTEADDVYAVGDVARAWHPVAGRALRVEHWGDAARMGAVAGAVVAGEHATWTDVPGFWSEIAGRQLKYVAWGDGHDEIVVRPSPTGTTIWYGRADMCVGVLTYEHDEDLELGGQLIAAGLPMPD